MQKNDCGDGDFLRQRQKHMMEMIDDTMTTGMLNSFNSGAFQISCLRWAHSLINDDDDNTEIFIDEDIDIVVK